ncbi:carbonic anhydrase 14-like [Amphiura filiformis]|uniref:carbonic anhydrase 14-like n=1 Tax=Amphiura filiformis TaxID=82378 RepID=UPI003B20DD42
MISITQTFLLIWNILLLLSSVTIDASKWGYTGKNGPEFWATLHGGEECGGESQSPINVDTDNLVPKNFGPWEIEYEDISLFGTEMHNNGHTLQISMKGTYNIKGGGLPHTYSAVQFHFHWGRNALEGSEHTRNGAAYPAEIHIVHYDSQKYFDVFAALVEPQGLAVLGFWVEVGEENLALNPIINGINNVTYKGQQLYFSDDQLRIKELLPANSDKFYRYEGSLTTPDCFESVVWTLFEQPITMSAEQLESLRGLSQLKEEETESEHIPIGHNYRPVQDVNKRTVYVNSKSGAVATHRLPTCMFILFTACFVLKL